MCGEEGRIPSITRLCLFSRLFAFAYFGGRFGALSCDFFPQATRQLEVPQPEVPWLAWKTPDACLVCWRSVLGVSTAEG